MKKLMAIITIVLLGIGVSYAQNSAPSKKTAPKAITAKKPTKAAPTLAGPTKKDGTADMRYKANKQAKPAGPTKKDGTADMRYKANKESQAKKKN